MRIIHPQFEQRAPREGFSLVEILVVLTIIGILSSLAFMAIGASGNAAREAATKAAIRVISATLRERKNAFDDLTASSVQIDPDLPPKLKNRLFREAVSAFRRDYANAPSNTMQIEPIEAEVFVRKAMYKALFPQREQDLWGYDGTSNNGQGDDSPLLTRMYAPGASIGTRILITDSWKGRNDAARAANPSNVADDDLAESSELLYLALTQGDVWGVPPIGLAGLDNDSLGDTDGDGNIEFIDGWGRPLQFYNWPSRLVKDDGVYYWGEIPFPALPATPTVATYKTTSLLISQLPTPPQKDPSQLPTVWVPATGSTAAHPMYRDPEDVTKAFYRPSYASPLLANFYLKRFLAAETLAMGFTPAWYHDVNTPTSPLIVSPGPDGTLGLYLPVATTNGGIDRLARVIHTEEDCQALADNLTNQQRGPQ